VKNEAVGSHFANSLYFSAGALAREAEKLAVACWKPVGLSPSHAQIVLFLLDFSVTSPSEIAKALLLSPSTITRLLDSLERKGLIVRFIYDEVRMVSPSNEARAREEEFLDCDMDFRRRYTKLLGDEHAAGLIQEMNSATDKLRGGGEGDRPDGDTKSGQ
jgi:MarR family transcriptional regulator, organic hydroperoxide resistance regulator